MKSLSNKENFEHCKESNEKPKQTSITQEEFDMMEKGNYDLHHILKYLNVKVTPTPLTMQECVVGIANLDVICIWQTCAKYALEHKVEDDFIAMVISQYNDNPKLLGKCVPEKFLTPIIGEK